MKNFELATLAISALVLAASAPATRASLTAVESGSSSFVWPGAGSLASFDINVDYDVVFDSGTKLYTYLYQFTPLSDSPIGQFQINANYVNGVLTDGLLISGAAYTLTGAITEGGAINSGADVLWSWNPATTKEQLVGFTSNFGPGDGYGFLTGASFGTWADSPSEGTPTVVPVPESSTVLAGVLVLLPLGIGALRSWRKGPNPA
jgi:hypothetical protein